MAFREPRIIADKDVAWLHRGLTIGPKHIGEECVIHANLGSYSSVLYNKTSVHVIEQAAEVVRLAHSVRQGRDPMVQLASSRTAISLCQITSSTPGPIIRCSLCFGGRGERSRCSYDS